MQPFCSILFRKGPLSAEQLVQSCVLRSVLATLPWHFVKPRRGGDHDLTGNASRFAAIQVSFKLRDHLCCMADRTKAYAAAVRLGAMAYPNSASIDLSKPSRARPRCLRASSLVMLQDPSAHALSLPRWTTRSAIHASLLLLRSKHRLPNITPRQPDIRRLLQLQHRVHGREIRSRPLQIRHMLHINVRFARELFLRHRLSLRIREFCARL